MFREQASELFARGCVTKRLVQRASRHAAGCGSDTRAERVHGFHRQFEAITFVADHVFSRDAALVERDFANWVECYQRRALDNVKARHLRADDESGKHWPSVFA